jgi:hypothetical protein
VDQPATADEPAAVQQATEPLPSPRSTSGDLWSGFAPGTTRAPGLNGLPTRSGRTSNPLPVLGMAMMGLAAVLGGFTVAEVIRRPTLARRGSARS